MSVKTCVVFLKFKIGSQLDYTETWESDVFGPDCKYASAYDFIQTVRKMHQDVGSHLKITNVVIG